MTVFAICVATVLAVVVVIAGLRRPPAETPVDPEAMMRAAVELHRIRRRLDVAYTKVEQRRDSSRLRRELAEEIRRLED